MEFIDEAGMDVKDRFMLMLIERVQALETAVAALEAADSTDSLSVIVENAGPTLGNLFPAQNAPANFGVGAGIGGLDDILGHVSRLFRGDGDGDGDGGGENGENDENGGAEKGPDARAIGEALLARGLVDVAEVTLAWKNRAKPSPYPSPRLGQDPFHMIASSVDHLLASKRFLLTVRLRSPAPVRRAVEAIIAAWGSDAAGVAVAGSRLAGSRHKYVLRGDWRRTTTFAEALAFGESDVTRRSWSPPSAPPPPQGAPPPPEVTFEMLICMMSAVMTAASAASSTTTTSA